jgi:hypothetical protein
MPLVELQFRCSQVPNRLRGDLARRRAAVVMARGSGVSTRPARKIVLMV